MLKVLTVMGTRPEAVKMAPVIHALRAEKGRIDCKVCVTAQHREMLDPFLRMFGIESDYDLDIMKANQSLEYITSTVLSQMGFIFEKERPDWVLVQGDTTSSFAASLAAFYQGIRVGHIEAGLRTGDKRRPFPEEMNRKLTDAISDLHFVPTPQAKAHLLTEGIAPEGIEVTGNTVIDALLAMAGRDFDVTQTPLGDIPLDSKRVIIVTAHRKENLGAPLERICEAVRRIAVRYAGDVVIVFPVHLNPRVQETAEKVLGGIAHVYRTPPLDYLTFIHLMKLAYLILTDSGGIQEEAPSLNVPVLVMRDVTERPEALEAGATRLVGCDADRIEQAARLLLDDLGAYRVMTGAVNPYGDGQAAQRIVARLLKE